MSVRILIVDDHAIMREGLCVLLRRDPKMEVVGQAHDGRSALSLARELSPDVVLMDILMPRLNGIEATRQMLKILPDLKVMVLSTYSNRDMVVKMLKAGAVGYMWKDSAFSELIEGINSIMENKMYLCSRVTDVVLTDYISIFSKRKRAISKGLTSRQKEVLKLVVEGYTARQIAEELKISIKTVNSHRERIVEKSGIHSIAGLTKFAIREGLTTL